MTPEQKAQLCTALRNGVPPEMREAGILDLAIKLQVDLIAPVIDAWLEELRIGAGGRNFH